MKKKNLIMTLVIVGLIALVAIKLAGNKQDMNEKAALANVTSDFIPVEILHPNFQLLNETFESAAALQPARKTQVISETNGKVIALSADLGSYVQRGQTIVHLDRDLAEAQVQSAKANRDKLQLDLKRFNTLLNSEAVTTNQVEEIEIGLNNAEAQLTQAQKMLDNCSITAPYSGIISSLDLELGQFVNAGAAAFTIIDNDKLILPLLLTEKEVSRIEKKQEVILSVESLELSELKGTVKSIASNADAAMKYLVEVELENTTGTLKGGMYTKAQLNASNSTQALMIPRSALLGSIKTPEVFVISNGQAAKRRIQIGETASSLVEVISGLTTQDSLIVSGQFNLLEGSVVKVKSPKQS